MKSSLEDAISKVESVQEARKFLGMEPDNNLSEGLQSLYWAYRFLEDN